MMNTVLITVDMEGCERIFTCRQAGRYDTSEREFKIWSIESR
jgi:hypothetical protein